MVRSADGLPNDPLIVLLDDDEPTGTLDEWLANLTLDEPTDVDVGAAAILREIRDCDER